MKVNVQKEIKIELKLDQLDFESLRDAKDLVHSLDLLIRDETHNQFNILHFLNEVYGDDIMQFLTDFCYKTTEVQNFIERFIKEKIEGGLID